MWGIMIHKEVKFSETISITFDGDNEIMTLTLVKDSKPDFTTTIRKHPGLLESIFPSCGSDINMAPLLANEEQKERIYRSRIKRCYKIKCEFADYYLEKYNAEQRKNAQKQKERNESEGDFDKFINLITES